MLNRIKAYFIKKIHAGLFRPGHFYHPIPGKNELASFHYDENLKGIDLNADEQLDFIKELSASINDFHFPADKSAGYRYYFRNSLFNHTDAQILFLILRFFKPKQIVEVGSGFSSAVMLDTDDHYFQDRKIDFTFIEPVATRIKSLLEKNEKVEIIEKKVQEVPIELFEKLGPNDILFIDSSHVSKHGSDVNHLVFKVLPILKKGVLVHFHDICYPFEYPRDWLERGIYWNEAYILRAFLSFNPLFKIMLFNHFLASKCSNAVKEILPEFKTGGSLWLKKI